MNSTALAQGSDEIKNKTPFPVRYTSEADQKILIKTLVLAPVYDNVNGVYAKPIEKLLTDMLKSDKVWGYAKFPASQKNIFIEQFDSEPDRVLNVLNQAQAQGMLTAFITKGPKGLTARLKLFTQDQGFLLLEESFQDQETFEVSVLREKFAEMYRDIKNRLPYQGYVLSRRGLDVTLNVGQINGVQVGQELALAQIIKINRHPKLKFMVGVEKEIIARVQITKVDSFLSFAQIIFEKETGVVEAGSKILPTDFVSYPLPQINRDGDVIGDIPSHRTQPVNPEVTPPVEAAKQTSSTATNNSTEQQKLGVITAQGVFSQLKESVVPVTGNSFELSKGWTPGIYLGAQLYYSENLFIDFNTQYLNFTTENPLPGSFGSKIGYSYFRITGAFGYDFILDNGPILTAAVGFSSIQTKVSQSAPRALTDTNIDAAALQLRAAIPVNEFTLGAKMDFNFAKKVSQSPVTSGDTSSTITSIGVFGTYPIMPDLRGRVDLYMNKINTEFSGGTVTNTNPARSGTIELTNLQAGIEYTF
ncbi:hypothetical protein [Pseudobdellovibrio exovorus]|uniref:hypothetical protein n=1 Tax=Pseudobdellovibrio exovorus TaxID=453816 RepID=UPI0011D21A56|nr:hypothetical protein [Pseudobdellovibrio exovorus]